jgi:small glutamine-rich tetratricopeptide repeat-containing protein alpha
MSKLPPQEQNAQCEKLKNEGNKFFQEGRYTEAIQKFTEAMTIVPMNPVLYSNRSFAYFTAYQKNTTDPKRKHNLKQSLRDAEMSVHIDPNWFKGHARIFEAALCLGKVSEATEALAKLEGLKPDSPDIKVFRTKLDEYLSKFFPSACSFCVLLTTPFLLLFFFGRKSP